MVFDPSSLLSKPDIPAPVAEKAQDLLGGFSPASLGFQTGENAVNDALAPIARISQKAQTFVDASLMGRGLTVQRFSAANPGKNWNKNFPYRFLVTRVDTNGKHKVVAEFRLPINPQELVTSTPYAIKGTVTSGGFLEEHNGAPIRQITINGTTGIMIDRQAASQKTVRKDIIGTIFSGTLDAIANAQRSVAIAGKAFGLSNASPFRSNAEDPALTRTGYYQYHMLRLFLDTYVETKKTPNSQDLRLIFESSKDNVSYIVMPVNKTERRTVQSPEEYFYSIQLLAWATVPDFVGAAEAVTPLAIQNSVSDFQRLLNAMKSTRRVVQSFRNIVSAARADIESNILGPINNVILLAKDILAIPQDIADFPKNIRSSLQTSVVANWNSLVNNNSILKEKFDAKIQDILNQSSGSASVLTTGGNSPISTFKPEVLDDLDLTENVQIGNLQLTDNQQDAVTAAANDAKDTTTNEVNTLIGQMNALTEALEPLISTKSPVDEEWDLLYSLNDSISQLYGLISNGALNNSVNADNDAAGNASLSNTALAFWEQSAADSNMPFSSPLGKFAIPFPFGSTLEQLAIIYLNDAQRWLEIAALNGLQYPYIDEEGFSYNFVGNGSLNQFNIVSNFNLFVGQHIYLSSLTQRVSKRKILAMSQISDTNFLITVDGDQNLNLFKTIDNAQMKAFLPYTVNSMKKIFIPTDVPSGDSDFDTPPITFLTEDLDLIKFSKIDWLLDSAYDLAVTSDGFQNLAFGTTNLVQASKLKMKTLPGAIPLSPEYGAGVEVGQSAADFNLETTSQRISQSFSADPRFNAPNSIQINEFPGVVDLNVVVSVAKDNGILPISFPLSKENQ